MPSAFSDSPWRRRVLSALPVALVAAALFASPWNADYFAHREAVTQSVPPQVWTSLENPSRSDPPAIGSAASGLPGPSGALPRPVPDPDAESRESVLTGPDPAILDRLVRTYRDARSEILVNVYLLTEKAVVDELVAAKKRGVDVRVILEKDPYRLPWANRKSSDRLSSAGVDVFQSREAFAFVHAKYSVVDGTSYVFSTGNYASTSFRKNREFFVFGNDARTASFLRSLFSADFRASPFSGPVPGRAYLAPLDARTKIVGFVRSAEKSLEVWAPSLSDPELLRELSAAAGRGVAVRVCLPEGSADFAELPPDIPAYRMKKPQLHAKTILVDRSLLLIGSANFTSNSLDRNREVGAVFSDSGTVRNYETTLRQDCKR